MSEIEMILIGIGIAGLAMLGSLVCAVLIVRASILIHSIFKRPEPEETE